MRTEPVDIKTSLLNQQRIELGLDRAKRNIFVIFGPIGAVEMSPSIQQIGTALHAEYTGCVHGKEHRHQGCSAVDHRSIHDLPRPRFLCFQHRAYKTKSQEHATPAKITNQIKGWHGLTTGFAYRMQCARKGNIVNIVTGGLRHRAFLTPASHAAVDQFPIATHTFFRANTEPLSYPGAETFKQCIG